MPKTLFRLGPSLAIQVLGTCALLPACRSEISGWVISERATRAPETDAADPDAGCPGCIGPIVLVDSATTPVAGSGMSTAYDDECPEDQVVIGFRGSVSDVGIFLVSSIQTVCGELGVRSVPLGDVGVTPSATLAERGLPSDAKWSQLCPPDQVVVAFSGRSGRSLDQVGFDCARIRVSRDGTNALTLSVETKVVELSPPNGGDGGMPFHVACSAGQIARGAILHADQWIDGLGLTCATPTFASKVGGR